MMNQIFFDGRVLECSVCLDRLDFTSKALPCQHTFCRKCLEVIVASHQELRCPECRVLVDVKIEDLPTNVLLMRILGGMKNLVNSNQQSTTNHDASNKVGQTDSALDQSGKQRSDQSPELIVPHSNSEGPKFLPQNICYAKALHDFKSNLTGDLPFKKGDVIVLRRRIDQNWFYGQMNGREGSFPVNHVQIIVPLPVPQCKALYDFQMVPVEDEGCLAFKKGQTINVIRRIDQNWAEGRISESIGIFPINFVEMNSLAKQLMHPGKTGQQNATSGTVVRAVPPAPPPDTSGPKSLPNLSQSLSSPSTGATIAAPKRNSMIAGSNLPSPATLSHTTHRHSAEILNYPETPRSSTRAEKAQIPSTCIAMYAYKPQKSDELELKKGSVYFVTERCHDGWLKGVNQEKKSGVFPGNYVTPYTSINNTHSPSSSGQASSSRENKPLPIASQKSPPLVVPPALPPRNQNSPYTDIFGRKNAEHHSSKSSPPTIPTPATDKREKEPSLMKRITNNLKRSSGSAATYSMDNPVFEDNVQPSSHSSLNPKFSNHKSHPVHVRSGSCPSQLLQHLSPNESAKAGSTAASLRHNPQMAFASQRLRGHKERPSLHNMQRQTSERGKETAHKKTQSLDAGPRVVNKPSNSQNQAKERFRCIVAYPPNSEVELELHVGDIVYVNKKRENGWYRGVLASNGKSGLFPASFVEPDI